MNIKIQGGGDSRYSNKGSCTSVVTYLQHEDMERAIEGKEISSFYNNEYDRISSREVTYKIDHNKSQLRRDDSKFFVITVSPSQDEIRAMGATTQARADALKDYVRNGVMQQYAERFNKNLNKENIRYYAKNHYTRGDKDGEQMHVHIIVSRKDIEGKMKLSPQTNHRNTTKGAVRGGFDRVEFIQSCQDLFDQKFNYERNIKDGFEYLNAVKNGSIEDMREQVAKAVSKDITMGQTKGKTMKREGVAL